MPSRHVLANELASLLKAVAHPDRVRLIEELRSGALGVSALSERLSLPATRLSQHLALLRAHRLVEERRDGRQHLYSLVDQALAGWLLDGVRFIEGRVESEIAARDVIRSAKELWRGETAGKTG